MLAECSGDSEGNCRVFWMFFPPTLFRFCTYQSYEMREPFTREEASPPLNSLKKCCRPMQLLFLSFQNEQKPGVRPCKREKRYKDEEKAIRSKALCPLLSFLPSSLFSPWPVPGPSSEGFLSFSVLLSKGSPFW